VPASNTAASFVAVGGQLERPARSNGKMLFRGSTPYVGPSDPIFWAAAESLVQTQFAVSRHDKRASNPARTSIQSIHTGVFNGISSDRQPDCFVGS